MLCFIYAFIYQSTCVYIKEAADAFKDVWRLLRPGLQYTQTPPPDWEVKDTWPGDEEMMLQYKKLLQNILDMKDPAAMGTWLCFCPGFPLIDSLTLMQFFRNCLQLSDCLFFAVAWLSSPGFPPISLNLSFDAPLV